MASFTASSKIIHLLHAFVPALTRPAFSKVVTLFCGVILSPGRRTVAAALRAVGLQEDQTFGKYYRLLARDRWSALLLSQQLLRLLVQAFIAPDQRIDLVVDETLERRQAKKIVYKSWYRDAVRSTQNVVVTVLGVRWLCFCLLVQTPWAKRRWALPFLSVPVLSQKTCARRKRPFRGGIGLTCDLIVKVKSWLGDKRGVRLIGDGGFTSMELITYCNLLRIVQIGRLRLDAALYDAPADQPSTKRGPKPRKGTRQPSLKLRAADPDTQWVASDLAWYAGEVRALDLATGTALWHVAGHAPVGLRWVRVRRHDQPGQVAALFSSDPTETAEQIAAAYAERWNIEVFFVEVRACLGFETQRGWTRWTMGRTTPCLFGVFSLVVLLAKDLHPEELPVRQAAWYTKEEATFRDVLSAVKKHLWEHNLPQSWQGNRIASAKTPDMYLISHQLLHAMREMACYAT